MSYIRIPSGNMSRNENELRALVDNLRRSVAALDGIADKMDQIVGVPADYSNLETEYNLSPGQGSDLHALVRSAADETNDSSPFLTQLIQRVA